MSVAFARCCHRQTVILFGLAFSAMQSFKVTETEQIHIIYHSLSSFIIICISSSIIIYHLSIICLSSSVYIIIYIFLDYPITLPLFQGLHCRGRPLLPPHPPTGNPPASVDPGPEMPRCPSGCDIPQGLRTCSGCFLVTAKSSWLKCYIY